jgi:FtsH-binding integral membrane protein
MEKGMPGLRFKKWAAIYFLAIALPATAAGLWGVSSITWLLQLPADSDAPEGGRAGHRLFLELDAALCVLVIIGLVNMLGYYRQLRRPHTVLRFFWLWSASYNLVASIALFFFLWPMAGPPTKLDPFVFVLGLGLAAPLIGLVLSVLCAVADDRVDVETP